MLFVFSLICRKRKRAEIDQSLPRSLVPTAATSASTAVVATPVKPTLAQPAPSPRLDDLCLPIPTRLNRWVLKLPNVIDRSIISSSSSASSSFAPSVLARSSRSATQFELSVTDATGRPITTGSSSATGYGSIISAIAAADSPLSLPRQLLWEAFVPYRILLTCANKQMIVLACLDQKNSQHLLVFYSATSGRLLYPPLLLTAPPFLLSMHTGVHLSTVLLITCDGLLRVYDLDPTLPPSRKKLIIQTSVRPMLRATAAAIDAKHKRKGGKDENISIVGAQLNKESQVLSNICLLNLRL